MGIQPIDLQTMYSQSSNVAKALSGANQAILSEEMQRQNNIQKGLEESAKVQKTSNDNTDAASVKEDGHNSEQGSSKNNSNPKNQFFQDNDMNDSDYKVKSPYLGTIIDISR